MEIKNKKELIVNDDGKIIHFPAEFFKNEICSGNRCFMCGKMLVKTETNEEHVLPNWLLREFSLHSDTIVLPNSTKFNYSKYKIPCCVECNSFLGENLETPISKILSLGYDAVVDHIKNNGPWDFIIWLSLIFFKIHYNDLNFNFELDRRKGSYKIGDLHDFESFHHLYTMARAIYVNSKIDKSALSSFFVVPAYNVIDESKNINFDFGDLSFSKSIFIRYNDIAIIACLDDGCAAYNGFQNFSKITGPLNPLQIRELFSVISYIATLNKQRTNFYTEINSDSPNGKIIGVIPEMFDFEEWIPSDFGKILYKTTSDLLYSFPDIGEKEHELIRNGTYGFLFDENGNFKENNITIQ